LAIQIRQHFQFSTDWYRHGPVAALILAYYVLLRAILRTQPELRRCRTRCRHCGIFFLADPRNAGRRDLGCPFGCREAHRRRQASRRSTAYYQDEQGKKKKRQQNAKRRQSSVLTTPPPATLLAEAPFPWPRPIVEYVRMVTTLIEGHQVSLAEVVEMLRRVLRQHSIVRTRRIDQIIAQLHGHPP
jgi:hypothetical protein